MPHDEMVIDKRNQGASGGTARRQGDGGVGEEEGRGTVAMFRPRGNKTGVPASLVAEPGLDVSVEVHVEVEKDATRTLFELRSDASALFCWNPLEVGRADE